jgi:hypothetical protein
MNLKIFSRKGDNPLTSAFIPLDSTNIDIVFGIFSECFAMSNEMYGGVENGANFVKLANLGV